MAPGSLFTAKGDTELVSDDERRERRRSPREAMLVLYKANWSLWTSVYKSKTFTKYSFYSLLAYALTDNPLLGALSFNCTLTSISLFNYIRFWFPDLFSEYRKVVETTSGIGPKLFLLGDVATHVVPFALSVKWLPGWYNRVKGKNIMAVSACSLAYQIGWAYFYAAGMDVSTAYDMEKSDKKLTGKDCKRIWVLIALSHFAVAGFRGAKSISAAMDVLSFLGGSLLRDLVAR